MVKWLKNFFQEIKEYQPRDFAPAQSFDIKQNAFHAEQLLNNPVYQGIIDKLRNEYQSLWLNSTHDQIELREDYYRYLTALNQINTRIKILVNEAIVDDQIKEFNTRQA
jgi:hypothetical protein